MKSGQIIFAVLMVLNFTEGLNYNVSLLTLFGQNRKFFTPPENDGLDPVSMGEFLEKRGFGQTIDGPVKRNSINNPIVELCDVEYSERRLFEEGMIGQYEYRPAKYLIQRCKGTIGGSFSGTSSIRPSYPSCTCVQLYRTVHLFRRSFAENCWRPMESLRVESDCVCIRDTDLDRK